MIVQMLRSYLGVQYFIQSRLDLPQTLNALTWSLPAIRFFLSLLPRAKETEQVTNGKGQLNSKCIKNIGSCNFSIKSFLLLIKNGRIFIIIINHELNQKSSIFNTFMVQTQIWFWFIFFKTIQPHFWMFLWVVSNNIFTENFEWSPITVSTLTNTILK